MLKLLILFILLVIPAVAQDFDPVSVCRQQRIQLSYEVQQLAAENAALQKQLTELKRPDDRK